MLALGLRTTSASSTAVHGVPRCCEPILPIPSGLLQPNITLALPADLHDLLAMAKTVLSIEGQSTGVECACTPGALTMPTAHRTIEQNTAAQHRI